MNYIRPRTILSAAGLLLPLLLHAGCTSEAASNAASNAENPLQPPLGLESVELQPSDDTLTVAKYELGKQLFFDTRLSGSGKTSCSSCHLPEHAFTDQRALSPKDNGKLNTRNSPTMYNVGYLAELYWDGRAKGMENNVRAAWTGQCGADPAVISKTLAGVDGYVKAFQATYGASPSDENIVKALSAFLRGLRSGDSAYDRFAAGDQSALSEQAQAGWKLFSGKAACITCHLVPLFTDRSYHNTGIGMTAEKPDTGAGNADNPSKIGAFKTPTLREIAKTAPYFHDGSVATLREAVKIMASGGIANPNKDPLLADRKLTDAEIDQLVAFLESLSGNQKFTPPVLPQ